MKINKFISIIDNQKIIECGKYNIGRDIPCGEYYLWGKSIWYSYKRKRERESREYVGEAYDIFQNGDVLTLEEGKMTGIDNIHYSNENTDIIMPNHIYRVGLEIPEGCYLYKFDKQFFSETVSYCKSDDECAFDMHKNFGNSGYHSETGKIGCVMLELVNVRHVNIKNGIAAYVGDEKFNEQKVLNDCSVDENVFFNKGIRIFDCKIMEMRLYKKYNNGGMFCGKIPVDVLNYYIYSVGEQLKWKADINPLSFKKPSSISIRFSDGHYNEYVATITNFSYHYDRENLISWYTISIFLPNNLKGCELIFELLAYNGEHVSERLEECASVNDTIYQKYQVYEDDFKKLQELLKSFDGLDIEQELAYFEKAPDLLSEVNECLDQIINSKLFFDQENGDLDKKIIFKIPATYDKKFYCAAKLADEAYKIEVDENASDYSVIFMGNQLAQIELMSYMFFDVNSKEEVQNREYINKKSYIFYAKNTIQQKINSLNEKYGYSSIITNSVLVRIIKIMNQKLQQRMDDIYSEISKEGRIQTKWSNEYRLFLLVSRYVEDAYYQYHCDWLGKQSYDIYSEKYKVAIEYQGQQHYEAVDLFGGEESLKYNIERDKRKKELSVLHGVRLLEWKYTMPVEEKNVIDFLTANGIEIQSPGSLNIKSNYISSGIEMAPIKSVKERNKSTQQKKKAVKQISSYIVQYMLSGELKNKFTTIGDAAKAVGISSTSISKVLRGERNTAGGYIWKKYDVLEDIPQVVEIDFDISLINDGASKKIAEIDSGGNVIKEYASILEASRKTNKDADAIRKCLKDKMGWRYL